MLSLCRSALLTLAVLFCCLLSPAQSQAASRPGPKGGPGTRFSVVDKYRFAYQKRVGRSWKAKKVYKHSLYRHHYGTARHW